MKIEKLNICIKPFTLLSKDPALKFEVKVDGIINDEFKSYTSITVVHRDDFTSVFDRLISRAKYELTKLIKKEKENHEQTNNGV